MRRRALTPDTWDTLSAPSATVVVTTKDRRDELPRALDSVLAQDAEPEVLVIDDGSSDGTADMVRNAYPGVRLHRNEQSVGLIAARNMAAEMASGDVLVSIDDDAAFSTPYVVSQTLRDISAPAIGAVSIPHADVMRPDGKRTERAPDGEEIWVTAVFVGTAYAIRRDVFLGLGGFRGDFVHQGEEADLCLRLLDAGWWCRVGRSDMIEHFESAQRNLDRMELYGRRNELLHVWANVPWPWTVPFMAVYAAKALRHGFATGRARVQLRGLRWGLRDIARGADHRRPVTHRTLIVDRRMRRRGMLPLGAVAGRRRRG